MATIIDILLNRKTPEKELFDAAKFAIEKLSQKFKVKTEKGEEEIAIDSNVWYTIFPGDPFSPKIMGLSENKSLIYYPKWSTPYSHKLMDKCKFVTIVSGCIYDENSDFKLSSEKINDGKPHCLKISPEDNFRPHTKGCECYAFVHVDDCNKLLSQICP